MLSLQVVEATMIFEANTLCLHMVTNNLRHTLHGGRNDEAP